MVGHMCCLKRRKWWNEACSFVPINILRSKQYGTYLGSSPGKAATKTVYASSTRMKQRGMKHRASFLSAYYPGLMGYLPGLLQGIPSCRSMQGSG